MLPPSPALNLSQHQGLFQWVSSSLQVAKVLELQLQYQALSLIFRVDFFRIDLICLLSKGLSRVFSRTTIWKASIHESAKSYCLLGKKFVSLGIKYTLIIGSVQFSCSVVSDSSQPHESEHTRPLCPSPPPGVYPNSCPSSRWCHPAISSSVVPFSSCPQSLPASGSFPMSQLFTWGGRSVGVSASASVLPMNTQDWSPLGWTGLILMPSSSYSKETKTSIQKNIFYKIHRTTLFVTT